MKMKSLLGIVLSLSILQSCQNDETNIMHIPADTRSAFPVISVQSPVSIQCCWQS